MPRVNRLLVAGLVLLCAAAPALAQDYIAVVEADLTLVSGPDTAGLAGAHAQMVLAFQPASQVPDVTTQAPTFYFTGYLPTSRTVTQYGFANAEAYAGYDAVAVDGVPWGTLKAGFW